MNQRKSAGKKAVNNSKTPVNPQGQKKITPFPASVTVTTIKDQILNVAANAHLNQKHDKGSFNSIGEYLVDYQEWKYQNVRNQKAQLENFTQERQVKEALKSLEIQQINPGSASDDKMSSLILSLCADFKNLDLNNPSSYQALCQKYNN